MPKATSDEVIAGGRNLASGARLKLFRPYVFRFDWDGSRAARAALFAADLADLAPSCGPTGRDNSSEPAERPLSVADPAARPSAPRPSPIALSASRRGTLAA